MGFHHTLPFIVLAGAVRHPFIPLLDIALLFALLFPWVLQLVPGMLQPLRGKRVRSVLATSAFIVMVNATAISEKRSCKFMHIVVNEYARMG